MLAAIGTGNAGAWSELAPLVDGELRRLAGSRLHRGPRNGVGVTDLVHETWLRLLRRGGASWQDRRHFYRVVARAMQGLLIDHARRRRRLKRGAGRSVTLHDEAVPGGGDAVTEMLAVHEALGRLAAEDPRQHEIVMLRYFHGLGIDEVAGVIGVSPATVDRQWRFARAWLRHQLDAEGVST